MRLLADYVLRTRTDEVPVSAPLREEDHSTRITMGFSANDANLVRHLAGQEAVLVRNIERPGEALARLRLVAVDPASSRLVAEVVGTPPAPERSIRTAAPHTSLGRPRHAGKALLTAGAVLGLILLVALGMTVLSRADRACASSMDCPDGFACAAWGNPAPGEAEYRSCERECRNDRDCPGSDVCIYVGVGVRVCRADR
ncbi:MAG TPA: hypothetical protein VGG91_10040 [Myxococcaceae bacterium]|jgi:hypothetical protein